LKSSTNSKIRKGDPILGKGEISEKLKLGVFKGKEGHRRETRGNKHLLVRVRKKGSQTEGKPSSFQNREAKNGPCE